MAKMKFPIIRTIDDVLPAIKGHNEFIVAERPFGTVVNYVVQLPDSFDDPIRRECRGIAFYKNGQIMSRPYHKFFNLGERNETRPANLDFSEAVIMDKLDGSMVRPIFFQNWIEGDDTPSYHRFELGTKMGITDVANQAYQWMNADPSRKRSYEEFIRSCRGMGFTPLFEWVSRQQRIVVDYPEDNLILTAIRCVESGRYYAINQMANKYGIPTVYQWGKHDLTYLEEQAKERQDIEGWVCAWPCGKRVKIKVDWYVNLHKVKESIAREKYVIEAILGDFLDDLKGKLQEQDLRAVEAFEGPFRTGLYQLIQQAELNWREVDYDTRLYINQVAEVFEDAATVNRAAKKHLASLVKDKPRWMQPILFSLWDGKIDTVEEGVINTLKNLCGTQVQIDNNRHLWGGARYQYGGLPIDS